MVKISERYNISATPKPFKGIQVNFCKTPNCPNFGVPSIIKKRPVGRPAKNSPPRDGYTLSPGEGIYRDTITHRCEICAEKFPIKSNQGIHEEYIRIKPEAPPHTLLKQVTCPNPECGSFGTVSIEAGTKYYYKHSKEKPGQQARYRCLLCRKVFPVSSRTNFTKSQPTSYKNRQFFGLLFGKMPLQRIIDYLKISPQTLYDKIDFFHQQFSSFAYQREKKLFEYKKLRRLYISVDQQDMMLNWDDKDARRNIILKAAGAADNDTGYVFASFINHDPDLDRFEIEKKAKLCGDNEKNPAFRRFARLWLYSDYEKASSRKKPKLPKGVSKDLKTDIENSYSFSESQSDVESAELISNITRLPSKGVQVHNEYSLYSLFIYLQKMFQGVEGVRFFLDRDSGLRAACLSGFKNEIINRTCDALFIAITTSMTIDDKKAILDQVNATLKNLQKMFPEKSRNDIKLMLLRERLKEMDELGRWQDKFLSHPFPTIDEPEKKSCLLTDFNDLEIDHLAWLHNKASLRGINQYFMNVRRRLSLLERPLSTPSNLGRRFYGYNSYSPEVVAKILCIFRTYYNYCRKGKYGITPAMRLGMSRGSIRVEDIIYGRKYSNYSFDKNAQKIKEEDKKRDIARALKAAKRRKKTSRKNALRKAQYKGFGTILEDFENRDTVFIDIETTGDKEKDTILEIAIVDDDGKILTDTIVNPKIPISEDAKNIHGISEEMATDKPIFSEIESQIINCIDGKLVIMFGAKFDLPYFPEKLKKLIDYECCMSWYSALQGRWNPESDSFQTINLESATYEIGYIWQGEQHRALPDAWACRAVWKYLLKIEQ